MYVGSFDEGIYWQQEKSTKHKKNKEENVSGSVFQNKFYSTPSIKYN